MIKALLLLVVTTAADALISPEPVSKLLQNHADSISSLKKACEQKLGAAALDSQPYSNDVFFLRYCLASEEDPAEAVSRLETNLDWRSSARGKSICDAATSAIAQATAGGGGWDNDPVLKAAPHSEIISKFLTPANVVTTSSSKKDLVYCIRAGSIDDTTLMDQVSIDQMPAL